MAVSTKDKFLNNARNIVLIGAGAFLINHEINDTKTYLHNAFGMEFKEEAPVDFYKDLPKQSRPLAKMGQGGGY